jgi:hypothetical protein
MFLLLYESSDHLGIILAQITNNRTLLMGTSALQIDLFTSLAGHWTESSTTY